MDPDGKPKQSGENSSNPDIEIRGATAFDDLLASDETIETFALPIGACCGLPGGTMEVMTLDDVGVIETINRKRWTSELRVAAVMAAEEEPDSSILE